MCGGMKFMDLSKESEKKRCICNYGYCESDVSIQVSLDDITRLINAMRKECENEIYQLTIRVDPTDDTGIKLAKDICRLEKLLSNLEKLRS